MATRGIRSKAFKSWLQGGWSVVKEKGIKEIQRQTANYANKKFLEMGKKYENIFVDVNKRLIECDKESHSPEEWVKINSLSPFEAIVINLTLHFLKMRKVQKCIVVPYNPDRVPGMTDTMISTDGSAFVGFNTGVQKALDTPTDLKVLEMVEKESRMIESKMSTNLALKK